jgi:hypothetical protein
MDIGELWWSDVDWIGLAQDRDKWRAVVHDVTNLRVPQNAGKASSGYTTGGPTNSAQARGCVCCEVQTSSTYKIWGFHGGNYEERSLLGFYAVWLL